MNDERLFNKSWNGLNVILKGQADLNDERHI